MEIAYDDFSKVDMRIGTILKAEPFPEAKMPSYKLEIDLGPVGMKHSSAHITNYSIEELVGKKVVCVVNFKPKQVANFMSEVLVLGVLSKSGVVLLIPDRPGSVDAGEKIA
ncbi:MAG: tRNA-binding protein [Candidatus Marsarchaeota archaeon]|jgi:tRNA-binding protein|nr:tRNA-binding protein [Candidatus Marsarchaeota archaeon]MCL5418623.1 tRNA-binding protein [Candidatus Marsarchaeota archaeon]